ncbi:hypothetical protein L484_022953 [Morus notabilis]|uniref:F-box associated domain-containing protein n=1 Tax=Morus notabilis TaxID=981085 RepID=W9RFR6_9ROSA|nr:hypothetical protein L484_022953 [Morus notabilis]
MVTISDKNEGGSDDVPCVVEEISLPPVPETERANFPVTLVVVSFISTDYLWHSKSSEMWVMVDNFGGVEGFTYWTKHLTIGPLVCIHYPLAFWKDDELLMQARDGGTFVSYNLNSQKFRKLPIHGMVIPWATHAYLCSKSLVSIKRRKNGVDKGSHAYLYSKARKNS